MAVTQGTEARWTSRFVEACSCDPAETLALPKSNNLTDFERSQDREKEENVLIRGKAGRGENSLSPAEREGEQVFNKILNLQGRSLFFGKGFARATPSCVGTGGAAVSPLSST